MRRNRLELIIEILEAIEEEGGITPTRLSQRVNLSYDRLKRILEELLEKNIIEAVHLDDRRGSTWLTLTQHGESLLRELRRLRALLEDYGLL